MKKYIFNLLLLFCCTCSVYAQNSSVEVQTNRIEVEGLVTDESKEPLIGVNVIIKDIPGLGAITDIDGKFKIKMEPYHRLVFSFIGFEKQEVLIKEQRTIKVGYNGLPKGCSDDEFPWETEENNDDRCRYQCGYKYTEDFHIKHY